MRSPDPPDEIFRARAVVIRPDLAVSGAGSGRQPGADADGAGERLLTLRSGRDERALRLRSAGSGTSP